MIRLALTLAMFLATAALAQETDPPEGDPLPTLDELLGTEGGASDAGAGVAIPEDAAGEELERLLSGTEIADEFQAAVDLMSRSARRLGASRDTGITTQRMQEDVLEKLDKLIADAERRGQQSNSSSSSSNSPQQGQQQPRQQTSPEAGEGDNREQSNPPGLRTGPMRAEEVADLAAWGSLPARVRDALVQGSTDPFSATYRKLTEAYYRMLAEEPKQ